MVIQRGKQAIFSIRIENKWLVRKGGLEEKGGIN